MSKTSKRLRVRRFFSNVQYIFYGFALIFGFIYLLFASSQIGDDTGRVGHVIFSIILSMVALIGTYLTIFRAEKREKLLRGFGILAFSIITDKTTSLVVELLNLGFERIGYFSEVVISTWLASSLILAYFLSKLSEASAWDNWSN